MARRPFDPNANSLDRIRRSLQKMNKGAIVPAIPAGTYLAGNDAIQTTAPMRGGGFLSTNPTLSMTQAGSTTNGWLSSTDWNTFNNKVSAPAGPNTSVQFNSSGVFAGSANLEWIEGTGLQLSSTNSILLASTIEQGIHINATIAGLNPFPFLEYAEDRFAGGAVVTVLNTDKEFWLNIFTASGPTMKIRDGKGSAWQLQLFNPTDVGLLVYPDPSITLTADLQQWCNSVLTPLAKVDKSGNITGNGVLLAASPNKGLTADTTGLGILLASSSGLVLSSSGLSASFDTVSLQANGTGMHVRMSSSGALGLAGDGIAVLVDGSTITISPDVLTTIDFKASGSTHQRGTVPDPGSTAGTTRFLREDATWALPLHNIANASLPSQLVNVTAFTSGGLTTSLPANYFIPGRAVRATWFGNFVTNVSQQIAFEAIIGNTGLQNTPNFQAAASTTYDWKLVFEAVCIGISGTTSQFSFCFKLDICVDAGSTAQAFTTTVNGAGPNPTLSQTVDCKFATTVANNTCLYRGFIFEALN